MIRLLSKGPLFSIAALGLLAGGCASQDDVAKAQSTADQALSAAQAAQHSADQNRTDINVLNQKVDQLNQRMDQYESSRHHGERG